MPDPREFALLEEDWKRNPGGPERDNLHAAQIIQAILAASAKKFNIPRLDRLVLKRREKADEEEEVREAAAKLDAIKW